MKVSLCGSMDDLSVFAVKTYQLGQMKENKEFIKGIENEVELLRELNNKEKGENRKGFIKLHEVYKSDDKIHLVMDYAKDGNLSQLI